MIGLDPSSKLLEMAGRVERHGLSVDFVEGSAEEIPAGESERRYGRNDLDLMHHS
jgi:ubiquinone/menaquinone biosynthesis C-methylase UbiE